jgi:uncharacterized protein YlxW (UPF0749 family)
MNWKDALLTIMAIIGVLLYFLLIYSLLNLVSIHTVLYLTVFYLFLFFFTYLLVRGPSPLRSRPEKDIEKEIKKYEEHLEKLEQLRKEGKIPEKAYEKLKQEYEKKLEELVDKLKK